MISAAEALTGLSTGLIWIMQSMPMPPKALLVHMHRLLALLT